VHRFTVALKLLQSLEPPASARATWPSACAAAARRQPRARRRPAPARASPRLRICSQPMDLLAGATSSAWRSCAATPTTLVRAAIA
jgi:hypothetical protein